MAQNPSYLSDIRQPTENSYGCFYYICHYFNRVEKTQIVISEKVFFCLILQKYPACKISHERGVATRNFDIFTLNIILTANIPTIS